MDATPYLTQLLRAFTPVGTFGLLAPALGRVVYGSGAPATYEASIRVITRASVSPNAAARLWAIELARILHDDHYVVFATDSVAKADFAQSDSQLVLNLEAQGISRLRARALVNFLYSQAGSEAKPLPLELSLLTMPDYDAAGPDDIASTYRQGYAVGLGKKLSEADAHLFAERYVYLHAPLTSLWQIRLARENPGVAPAPATPATPATTVNPLVTTLTRRLNS